jgi:CHAT domain-containing protein
MSLLLFILFVPETKAQDSLAHYSVVQLDSIITVCYDNATYAAILSYAEAGYQKAIEKDTLYARACYYLGFYYDYELGDYDKAFDYYKEAFELQAKIAPTSDDYMNSLVKIGEFYHYVYAEYDKAELLYLKGLEIYESSPYSRSIYVDIKKGLGLAYKKQARYKEAEEVCKEACEISAQLYGAESEYCIGYLNVLASLYLEIAKYDESEKIYLKLLALSEEVYGKESNGYTLILCNLAYLYQMMRVYPKVEALYKEAIEIEAIIGGESSDNYALTISNLAFFYHSINRYQEAEPLYLKAHSINQKVLNSEHPDYSLSLNNLGGLYSDMMRYEEAEALYTEALGINEKIYGKLHPEYGRVLNNLAGLYLKQKKNLFKVEKMYLETQFIEAEFYGKASENYALSLNNLAFVYEALKRYEDAEKMYLEALEIQTKRLGANNILLNTVLSNLADLYLKQKKYMLSEAYYKRCIKIQEQSFDKSNVRRINTLNYLASLYFEKKDYSNAWIYLQQAIENNLGEEIGMDINLEWAEKIATKENISIRQMISVLKTVYNLLGAEKLDGNIQKQEIVSELALQLLKKSRDSFIREKDKLNILKKNTNWVLRNFRVIDKTKNVNRAFEIAEQNKSVLLMDLAQTQAAYRFGDLPDSLAQQEKSIHKDYSKLKAKLLERRSKEEKDSLLNLLNNLNLSTQEFNKKIEVKYPKYAAFKYQKLDVSIKDIQEQLDEKTALIEYVLGEDSVVYIFYIDKQTSKLVEEPVAKKELQLQIKRFHAVLSNYRQLANDENKVYEKYTNLAHWFFKTLLSPILPETPQVKNLIIITDGELGHLPFEAFLVKEAAQRNIGYSGLHYLLNDYNVSYDYSATLWKDNNLKENLNNNNQLLAMASDYTILLDSVEALNRLPANQRLRAELGPLPAAKAEIMNLSKSFSGSFIYGMNASEKIFKEKAPQYGIIHLAMHGVLDRRNQMLSGLVFTENGDSLENNYLQAYEISKMNLNANLVVLSACETGYGKFEEGNGIASLARAFMYAGTPSLIVSLWQVNDDATSYIMKTMYENLSKGMSKSAALSNAKLVYIKNSKGFVGHPAFWAAFVQIGNTNPIVIEQKGASKTWLMALGGVLLLLGLMGYLYKRKEA